MNAQNRHTFVPNRSSAIGNLTGWPSLRLPEQIMGYHAGLPWVPKVLARLQRGTWGLRHLREAAHVPPSRASCPSQAERALSLDAEDAVEAVLRNAPSNSNNNNIRICPSPSEVFIQRTGGIFCSDSLSAPPSPPPPPINT